MPHVHIRHFPVEIKPEVQAELVSKLTQVIEKTFKCPEGAVSIALQPIEREKWDEEVYMPEIVNHAQWLVKHPNY